MTDAQKQKVREELESIGFGNQARIVGAKRVELYSYLIQKLDDQEKEIVERIEEEINNVGNDYYDEANESDLHYAVEEIKSKIIKKVRNSLTAKIEYRKNETTSPIKQAWEVKGPAPAFHDHMKEKLKREWPTLYYAIINSLKS